MGSAQRRVRLDRLVREGCSKEVSFEAETRKVGGAPIAPLQGNCIKSLNILSSSENLGKNM